MGCTGCSGGNQVEVKRACEGAGERDGDMGGELGGVGGRCWDDMIDSLEMS